MSRRCVNVLMIFMFIAVYMSFKNEKVWYECAMLRLFYEMIHYAGKSDKIQTNFKRGWSLWNSFGFVNAKPLPLHPLYSNDIFEWPPRQSIHSFSSKTIRQKNHKIHISTFFLENYLAPILSSEEKEKKNRLTTYLPSSQ